MSGFRSASTWWRRHRPALVLFAIVFGALYYVGTRDYPVKRAHVFEDLVKDEVTPEKPLELEWPRRKAAVPAPPLSLTIPSYAFAPSAQRLEVPRLTTGHGLVYLFALLPDSDGLSAKSLGDWCPGGLESEGCHVAVLRLTVMQDEPDRADEGAMVMTSKARGLGNAFSAGPIRRLNTFWVKEMRATGRIEFVGWDCEDEPRTGVVTTDVARPLLERNSCFEPSTKAERLAPKRHGYQRFVQLTACAGDGTGCKVYFPFRGRYVAVEPEQSPVTFNTEQATGYVFLAAWEFLNRLRADSVLPPSPDARLARATRALENCRAIHANLPPPSRERFNERNQLLTYAENQCAYAAQLAATALGDRPADAGDLVLAALSVTRQPSSLQARLRQAALDAMGRAGASNTPQAVQARLELALAMPGGEPGSPQIEAKRAALGEVLRLADEALPPGSKTHLEIYRLLAYSYAGEQEADSKTLQLERWRAAVRTARGPADRDMREPTYQLCHHLEATKRIDRLKACADEGLPLWLAMVSAETTPMLSDAVARVGLDLLRWYSRYAAENKPDEVLPTMRKIAVALQPRVSAPAWAAYGEPEIRYVEQRMPISNRSPAGR